MARILVVERDDPAPSGLEPDLRDAGFSAVVTDTASALFLVPTGRFDLVLLDDGSPGSRAVLDAALRCTPAVPVIVLDDREDVQALVDTLDYGAADYLSRPFRFDELAARMRRSLRIARADDRLLAGSRASRTRARPRRGAELSAAGHLPRSAAARRPNPSPPPPPCPAPAGRLRRRPGR